MKLLQSGIILKESKARKLAKFLNDRYPRNKVNMRILEYGRGYRIEIDIAVENDDLTNQMRLAIEQL